MRRSLWVGAFVVLAAFSSCKTDSEGNGDGPAAVTEAGTPSTNDGGSKDDSGSGTGGPVDTTPPTFGGVKTVTAMGQDLLGVTWDPASDDLTPPATIAYRVYIATTAGGQDFKQPVLTTPAGATGATIVGLGAGTTYFVVVRAVDAAGNADSNTKEASATTLDNEPPTFGGVKAVDGTGAHEAKVTWAPASDNGSDAAEIVYEVFASATTGGQDFSTPTLTTAPGATEATLTGLPEAKPVFVVVRAKDPSGNKDINKKESVGTTLDKTAPTFPGLTSATAFGTTINLSWSAATDNVDQASAIRYDVFRSTTAGTFDFSAPIGQTLAGVTTFAATNLNVSTKYYFVVRARDSVDNVDTNTVEKSATTAASPDVKAPTFAGLGAATATSDQTIDLSWTAATDDYSPAAQLVYDIFVANVTGGESFQAPSYTTGPGATNFTVTGLVPVTNYYFVVRARDQAGNQDKNVVEKSAQTLPDTVPPSFGGLVSTVAVGPTAIQLDWAAATDDISPSSAIKYRIYRSTSTMAPYASLPAPVETPAGQTSATITGLNPSTKYFFIVRAVDQANTADANTIEKTGTTDPDVLAPTFAGINASSSTSPTSVSVGWPAATDDVTPSGQIVYLVYIATTVGGLNFSSPTLTTAAGASSATLTGLSQDTDYYVVVRAKDVANQTSAPGTPTLVRTQKDVTAPSFTGAGSVTNATDQTLTLTWPAATDNVTPAGSIKYLLCRSTVNNGCVNNFVAQATVTGAANCVAGNCSYVFTGLVPESTHYFVVRAQDATNNNTDTNTKQVFGSTIKDLVVPTFSGLVTGGTATSTTPTTIGLTWTAGSDDVTPAGQLVYDIYMANTPGGENFGGPSFTTAAGATNYTVTGLLPGNQRCFVVRARDQYGNSSAIPAPVSSQERCVTVIADTVAPTFPNAVRSVTNAAPVGGAVPPHELTRLNVSWTAASDNVTPVANIVYEVCWSTGATCTFSGPNFATTAAGATSYQITGLSAGTTYAVNVRARDAYNNTSTNTPILKATLADSTAPVMSGNPQIGGSTSTSLKVTWPAATDDYASAASLTYKVCMSTVLATCQNTNGATWPVSATVSGAGALEYNFAGLTNGTTYYFVVRVQDPTGNINHNETDYVSGTPSNDTTAPTFSWTSPPATLISPTSSQSISLFWTAATDDLPAAQLVYDVYRSTSPIALPLAPATLAAPNYTSAAGATTIVATGLTPNTPYYFHIKARDQAGNRSANDVAGTQVRSATTLADTVKPTFAGITGLNQMAAPGGLTQLQAVWSAGSDDTTPVANISYEVCWGTAAASCGIGGTSFTAMATTAAGATSYTITGLVPHNVTANTYYAVVRAKDAYGNTSVVVDNPASQRNNVTLDDGTAPGDVVNPTATQDVPPYSAIKVQWTAATDNYTSAGNMSYSICKTTISNGCAGGAFVQAALVTSGTTQYTFTNQTPSTVYYFVVRAVDQAGNVNASSAQFSVSTAVETVPPTFGGLTGVTRAFGGNAATTLNLAWSAGSDTYTAVANLEYDVYQSTTIAGAQAIPVDSPTILQAGGPGAVSTAVGGLSPGTQYCFIVRARDQAGNRSTNNTATCATTRATAPSFSAGPSIGTVGTGSIQLNWTATSSPSTTLNHYVCISTLAANCPDNFAGGTFVGSSVAGGAMSYTFNGLTSYTVYYMRVRVENTDSTTLATYSNAGGTAISQRTNAFPPTVGTLSCATNNWYPSYVRLTMGASSTDPQDSVTAVYYCAATSSLGCAFGWADEGTLVNGGTRYAGSNASWNPPVYDSVGYDNGPAMTPNTSYYVTARVQTALGFSSYSNQVLCTSPISYTQNIAPTFTSSCNSPNGCHTAGGGTNGPWSYTYFQSVNNTSTCGAYPSYTIGGNSGSSFLWRKVALAAPGCGGKMPDPTVGAYSFSTLLQRWLDQGRWNN